MPSKDKRAKKRPKYTTRAKYPAAYPCGCVHRSAHKRIDELYGCRCGGLWRVSITWEDMRGQDAQIPASASTEQPIGPR